MLNTSADAKIIINNVIIGHGYYGSKRRQQRGKFVVAFPLSLKIPARRRYNFGQCCCFCFLCWHFINVMLNCWRQQRRAWSERSRANNNEIIISLSEQKQKLWSNDCTTIGQQQCPSERHTGHAARTRSPPSSVSTVRFFTFTSFHFRCVAFAPGPGSSHNYYLPLLVKTFALFVPY